jgi:hypothetical protein
MLVLFNISQLPLWTKRVWMVEPFDPAAAPGTCPLADDLVEYLPEVARNASGDATPGPTSDDRGWRAKRNDERGTWRLRGSQVLYGCQPIVPDDKSVFLVKRQRVGDGFFVLDKEGRPTPLSFNGFVTKDY